MFYLMLRILTEDLLEGRIDPFHYQQILLKISLEHEMARLLDTPPQISDAL